MTESFFNLSEIKSALNRNAIALKQYKLLSNDSESMSQEFLTFMDISNGTNVSGKFVRSSNERDNWPLFNHENIAPFLDVLNVSNDLTIYITIHIEVKLKDMIHTEDFFFNDRCFERKKVYARGILSGLSYIHGKSLCLMNLSDDNIYICNTHDKAVIANFDFISSSRKTTRDKLKVPELYKAPETEKQEFDAIAAEMWSCGTLMLDLFLTHMVPWEIIDYKPLRVMEMVEKELSLEFLQVANTGSIISETDLVQFKAFLNCFFKESKIRFTALYASYASFLSTKLENKEISTGMCNRHYDCVLQQTERKSPVSEKNVLQLDIQKTDISLINIHANNNNAVCMSEEYFDCNGSREEICLCADTPTWHKSNDIEYSDLKSTESEENIYNIINLSNLPLNDFIENKGTKYDISINKMSSMENANNNHTGSNDKLYHVSEDKEDSISSSKIFLNKSYKNCLVIKKETNKRDSESRSDQSTSLLFINHRGKNNYEYDVEDRRSRNYFCSTVSRPLDIESRRDFGKKCLFENNPRIEKSMPENNVSHEVLNTAKTQNLNRTEDSMEEKNRETLPKTIFESMQEMRLPSRNLNPHSNYKMSVQSFKERFKAIKKAERFLEDHKMLFISEDLAEKQQSLIIEYRDILLQEKMRLCEVFSNELSEVSKLLKLLGSKSRCNKSNNKRRPVPNKLQYSSSEFSDYNSADMLDEDTFYDITMKRHKQKLTDSKDRLKLKSRKNLSYRNALESATYQVCKNWDCNLHSRKDPEKRKLILKRKKAEQEEVKNGKKAKGARELQIAGNQSHQLYKIVELPKTKHKRDDSKKLLKVKKQKKRGKKDVKIQHINKTKTTRKPFFFSLCPGGKVEESTSDDSC